MHTLFKQRTNKRFSYKPRYQREQQDNIKDGFESKLKETQSSGKRKGNRLTSLPVLVILFVMVLILMYILNNYQ